MVTALAIVLLSPAGILLQPEWDSLCENLPTDRKSVAIAWSFTQFKFELVLSGSGTREVLERSIHVPVPSGEFFIKSFRRHSVGNTSLRTPRLSRWSEVAFKKLPRAPPPPPRKRPKRTEKLNTIIGREGAQNGGKPPNGSFQTAVMENGVCQSQSSFDLAQFPTSLTEPIETATQQAITECKKGNLGECVFQAFLQLRWANAESPDDVLTEGVTSYCRTHASALCSTSNDRVESNWAGIHLEGGAPVEQVASKLLAATIKQWLISLDDPDALRLVKE